VLIPLSRKFKRFKTFTISQSIKSFKPRPMVTEEGEITSTPSTKERLGNCHIIILEQKVKIKKLLSVSSEGNHRKCIRIFLISWGEI